MQLSCGQYHCFQYSKYRTVAYRERLWVQSLANQVHSIECQIECVYAYRLLISVVLANYKYPFSLAFDFRLAITNYNQIN